LAASRAEWEKLQEGLGNVFGSVGSKRRGNA
jgi:hypothetical protein